MANDNSPVRSFFAGAIAGLTVDLSLYPLDTIKTRIQSREGFKTSGGFKSIYRGMSSIALGSAPGSALFFVTYNSTKSWLPYESSFCEALRASIGEVAACLVRVPTELVKQRAQVSSGPTRTLIIVKEIYKSRGFAGFYKGYLSTIFREVPFSFIEFPIWEYLKRKISTKGSPCSPLKSAICGSVAGFLAAGITTPLDVIKTRIMLDKGTSRVSILQTARSIVGNEGPLRLYSGIVPRSMWMGIGGFIFFFSYELASNAAKLLKI